MMGRKAVMVLMGASLAAAGCGQSATTTFSTSAAKITTAPAPPTAATTPQTSPEEEHVKANLVVILEMVGAIESIKDEKSADDAVPRLKKAAGQAAELAEKGKALKPDALAGLQNKYKKDFDDANQRLIKGVTDAATKYPTKGLAIAEALENKAPRGVPAPPDKE